MGLSPPQALSSKTCSAYSQLKLGTSPKFTSRHQSTRSAREPCTSHQGWMDVLRKAMGGNYMFLGLSLPRGFCQGRCGHEDGLFFHLTWVQLLSRARIGCVFYGQGLVVIGRVEMWFWISDNVILCDGKLMSPFFPLVLACMRRALIRRGALFGSHLWMT